jgi:hypothetical protein
MRRPRWPHLGDRRNDAVETTSEGRPLRIKLRRVKGFGKAEIAKMAKRDVAAFQYRYNRRYRLADMIAPRQRCPTDTANAKSSPKSG